MEKIKISTEYIKLDQFLKWCGVAQSGTHSKDLIFEGLVKVNDEVELRRGKKLRIGDQIEVSEQVFIIE